MRHACAAALIAFSVPAVACELAWDYDGAPWIDGFRFYQDGVETGTAAPDTRTISCGAAGLVPGPGPITATAYRGTNESKHSDPATFDLSAPGLRVIISTP